MWSLVVGMVGWTVDQFKVGSESAVYSGMCWMDICAKANQLTGRRQLISCRIWSPHGAEDPVRRGFATKMLFTRPKLEESKSSASFTASHFSRQHHTCLFALLSTVAIERWEQPVSLAAVVRLLGILLSSFPAQMSRFVYPYSQFRLYLPTLTSSKASTLGDMLSRAVCTLWFFHQASCVLCNFQLHFSVHVHFQSTWNGSCVCLPFTIFLICLHWTICISWCHVGARVSILCLFIT